MRSPEPVDERFIANLTNVHRRIMFMTADGEPHAKEEVFGCLSDELGNINNIHQQISSLRKRLRPRGQDILCEIGFGHGAFYRRVMLLKPLSACLCNHIPCNE